MCETLCNPIVIMLDFSSVKFHTKNEAISAGLKSGYRRVSDI